VFTPPVFLGFNTDGQDAMTTSGPEAGPYQPHCKDRGGRYKNSTPIVRDMKYKKIVSNL